MSAGEASSGKLSGKLSNNYEGTRLLGLIRPQVCEYCDVGYVFVCLSVCLLVYLNNGAQFTKYLTTILRLSYDNAKVTIDLRQTSNVRNILRRAQGFS